MSSLIDRAREYVKDKFLDLADVPKFIEAYVQYFDENKRLEKRVKELEVYIELHTKIPSRI